MTFPLIQVLLSILAAMLLVYKLVRHSDRCSFPERLGIGLLASSLVLNIGPIIAQIVPFGCPPTPFDNWGSALMRVGFLLYFGSRVSRHWRANRAQLRLADDHFRTRGKP